MKDSEIRFWKLFDRIETFLRLMFMTFSIALYATAFGLFVWFLWLFINPASIAINDEVEGDLQTGIAGGAIVCGFIGLYFYHRSVYFRKTHSDGLPTTKDPTADSSEIPSP